jgi:hypothetical protein
VAGVAGDGLNERRALLASALGVAAVARVDHTTTGEEKSRTFLLVIVFALRG